MFTIGLLFALSSLVGADVDVANSDELREAIETRKQPGRDPVTTITLKAGVVFQGDVYIENLKGTEGKRVLIQGEDPDQPTVFKGGKQALHLVNCSYVTLRNIKVVGFPSNGINIDDGGSYDTPSEGIELDNVTIENTGPNGNHDALKMSGVDGIRIRNCVFRGWGGSAIDMVGCHDGEVSHSSFFGIAGHSQSSGVQLKGGTSNIRVLGCFFDGAGSRAINLGGSTGDAYFRPQDANYEAREIEVAGCRFVGSQSPIAFVNADGAHVHHNTIYLPEKWVFRILQERPEERFVRCRKGVVERNCIVIDQRVRTTVNVGGDTEPESFTFRENAWFRIDGEVDLKLPTPETGGLKNVDPGLKGPGTSTMSIRNKQLKGVGADAWKAD